MIQVFYNFCVFVLIFFIFVSYLGQYNWICDLLSNFRLYYIFACIVFVILAIILRNAAGVLLLLVALFIQFFTVYSSYSNNPQDFKEKDSYEEVNLLQYNVHFLNRNYSGIVDYLLDNQEKLDVVFLQEVAPGLKEELNRIEKYFPYKVVLNEQWFGRAFYSKLPILNHEIKFFNHKEIDRSSYSKNSKDLFFVSPVHYLVVQLKTEKQSIPLTIYGIHTTAPFSKQLAERRNHELETIGKVINQDLLSTHKILLGDFNITSSSYFYKLLEKSTGLISAERGTGVNNTWPSWLKFNLMRISIDNAMFSKNIIVEERKIGENKGSDHLPVILKLRLYK